MANNKILNIFFAQVIRVGYYNKKNQLSTHMFIIILYKSRLYPEIVLGGG